MKTRSRKRIALFYPLFAGGGAEAVAIWAAHALQDDYDVTIVTIAHIDIQQLNRMYATNVSPDRVAVTTQFPKSWAGFCRYVHGNSAIGHNLLTHYFIRWFKTIAKQFDVCISGYNAVDFGCPGIQYIHWHNVLFNTGYYWLSDFSEGRAYQNISVANSRYTADKFEERCGHPVDVLYPPVPGEEGIEIVPWDDRPEFSFICSGRITKPKTPHRIIELLDIVRQRGYNVKLHITGGCGGVYASSYVRKVQRLAKRHADWVTLHTDLPYDRYIELLRHCRYGFHMKPEPFGISVAEMVQMGLIPFVRDWGGQLEIVGTDHPELLIGNEHRFPDQITAVLDNAEKQRAILKSLDDRRALFVPDRFIDGLRQVVADRFALT